MTANLTRSELGELLAAGARPGGPRGAAERAGVPARDRALPVPGRASPSCSRRSPTGGYAAVDAAFADPPDSTEQVLHPDKYAVREEPLKVVDPERPRRDGWAPAGRGRPGHARRADPARSGCARAASAGRRRATPPPAGAATGSSCCGGPDGALASASPRPGTPRPTRPSSRRRAPAPPRRRGRGPSSGRIGTTAVSRSRRRRTPATFAAALAAGS